MRRISHSLLALVLLTAAGTASADTVKMKDGTVHEGKIVSESDTTLVIETAALGSIPLATAEIESIRRDEAKSADGAKDPAPVADGPDETAKPVEPDQPDSVEEDEGDEPAAAEGTGGEEATASDRLARRFSARIVRTTRARTADLADKPVEDEAPEATIGGRALSHVEAGTKVIVVQPPARFEAALEVIEIGKRQVGVLEMSGTATAWLKVEHGDTPRRVGLRLADVKRHVEIRSPSAHARVIEGVSPGDWLRVVLADGSSHQGRLGGYSAGGLELIDPEAKSEETAKTVVRVQDIVELDGFLRNKRVHQALEGLEEREYISILRWPTGEEIMGRFVTVEKDCILIDEDGDGSPDVRVNKEAPIAEIRRVPLRLRREVTQAGIGDWLRFETIERFEDAEVTRIHRGRIIGITPHAVCLEDEDGARVVPLARAARAARLPSDERNRLRKKGRFVPADSLSSDLPVLPGAPAASATTAVEGQGISALTSGRYVSHVFVAPPFMGRVFGISLGQDAVTAARKADLDFDTIVVPQQSPREPFRPTEMVSETVENMRFTLLVDAAGNVSAMELSMLRGGSR